jgi:hypothetical protein
MQKVLDKLVAARGSALRPLVDKGVCSQLYQPVGRDEAGQPVYLHGPPPRAALPADCAWVTTLPPADDLAGRFTGPSDDLCDAATRDVLRLLQPPPTAEHAALIDEASKASCERFLDSFGIVYPTSSTASGLLALCRLVFEDYTVFFTNKGKQEEEVRWATDLLAQSHLSAAQRASFWFAKENVQAPDELSEFSYDFVTQRLSLADIRSALAPVLTEMLGPWRRSTAVTATPPSIAPTS